MDKLELFIPKNSIDEIARIFVPENTLPGSELELKIRIISENLTVREFSNYFSLLDRFYGRMYSGGIYAYGHREKEQIKISEIRSGSIETIIKESIDNIGSYHNLVIVYLLMKYLPNIIKSSAEAVQSLTQAYKNYEEASQLHEERINRKRIRQALRDDEQLQQMDSNRLDQIVKLLDSLYALENKKLTRAIKTAKKKIVSITLRVIKKNK